MVLLYVWLLRQRDEDGRRFSSLSLIKPALGKSKPWRRHVPPFLLWLALACALVGSDPKHSDSACRFPDIGHGHGCIAQHACARCASQSN
jgi:hypothetical protein